MTILEFTALNTNHCVLDESRIDLWLFSLAKEPPNAYNLLAPEEQARGDRFYFPKHRRRFCTARALSRIILSRYLKTTPESLNFIYNAQGKPEVVNSQKLHFNISHSKDLALLAVGKRFPMGVDIEYFSSRPYEGIARNLFSENEIQALEKTPTFLKPAVFFHIWAQKEAFIKASGLGLSYPTQEFSVPTTIPSKQLIRDFLHQTTWQVCTFMPEVGCSGALCHNPEVREIRYGSIDIPFGHG